ncbi:MAG TPA: 2-amino-4-hydroxy-6-hydroxymethyldihydropteridine diphosphokinase [Mycobacteriales bacterium]|nr:2-amino-4-hydroxy-6-hydroxymethyldihydropteridine diphosphokinase [Mycobacteriales bacterium]
MTAVVSLGGNLGDRAAYLRRAIEVIAMQVPVRAVSSLYESAPIGVTDSPAYLNAVVVVDSGDAERVFQAAGAAERSQGRLRSRRWGPRTLDADVIAVDQQVSASPRLTLPHPRAHERAFVLMPWLEVDATASITGYGPVRRLLEELPDQHVVRVAPAPPLP